MPFTKFSNRQLIYDIRSSLNKAGIKNISFKEEVDIEDRNVIKLRFTIGENTFEEGVNITAVDSEKQDMVVNELYGRLISTIILTMALKLQSI